MIKGIFVQPSARESLVVETEKFRKVETGGVLCGNYRDQYLVIESASGPGPDAIHSMIEFVIDKQHMDDYLDREYRESNGLNIYIGEWHTHPQVFPKPSPQDMQSIFERSYEWKHGAITFLIIGFYKFTKNKLKDQIIALYVDTVSNKIYQIPIVFL